MRLHRGSPNGLWNGDVCKADLRVTAFTYWGKFGDAFSTFDTMLQTKLKAKSALSKAWCVERRM